MGYFNSQFIVFLCIIIQAVVAEWLRRLTRNQIPSGSVGSSPTDCEVFHQLICALKSLHFQNMNDENLFIMWRHGLVG